MSGALDSSHAHDGTVQIVIPASLGRIEVRGEGQDNALVKEGCEWVVEYGKKAVDEGALSEGAYLEMCNLTKAKYVGICPNHHRQTLFALGETVVRMAAIERDIAKYADKNSELQNKYSVMQDRMLALQNKHSDLQEDYLQAQREQKALLEKDITRTDFLTALLKEANEHNAFKWTDELKRLSNADTEACFQCHQAQLPNTTARNEPGPSASGQEPRRSKRKRV